jgi:hypothetical protein
MRARRAPTTPDIEHNAVTETINEGDAQRGGKKRKKTCREIGFMYLVYTAKLSEMGKWE